MTNARFTRACAAALCLAALAACASPSPKFAGSDRVETTVGDSRFAVFRRVDEVEVYRISPEPLPNRAEVHAKARVAIAQATGCPILDGSLHGDQALMVARLDCPG